MQQSSKNFANGLGVFAAAATIFMVGLSVGESNQDEYVKILEKQNESLEKENSTYSQQVESLKLELFKDLASTRRIIAPITNKAKETVIAKNEHVVPPPPKKTVEELTISTQETKDFFGGKIAITLLGTNYTGSPLRHKVYASIFMPGKKAIKVEATDPGATIDAYGFQVLIVNSGTFSAGFKVFDLSGITKP